MTTDSRPGAELSYGKVVVAVLNLLYLASATACSVPLSEGECSIPAYSKGVVLPPTLFVEICTKVMGPDLAGTKHWRLAAQASNLTY